MTKQEILQILDRLQQMQRDLIFQKPGYTLHVEVDFTENNHEDGTFYGWSINFFLHDKEGIVARGGAAVYYGDNDNKKMSDALHKAEALIYSK